MRQCNSAFAAALLSFNNCSKDNSAASSLPDFRITHFDDYQAYLGHQETNTGSTDVPSTRKVFCKFSTWSPFGKAFNSPFSAVTTDGFV